MQILAVIPIEEYRCSGQKSLQPHNCPNKQQQEPKQSTAMVAIALE
ncbi:MAG: hypothetical protein M3299_02175 [Thermoproteota archaeon]|nr:hypothetical protein [Thermoproteota archaeon]